MFVIGIQIAQTCLIQVLIILFAICNHSMQFIFKSNERSREWSRRKTEW